MKWNIDTNFDAEYLQQFGRRIDSLAGPGGCHAGSLQCDLYRQHRHRGLGCAAQKLTASGHRLKISGLRGQPLQLFINLKLIPLFCGG